MNITSSLLGKIIYVICVFQINSLAQINFTINVSAKIILKFETTTQIFLII